MDQLVEIIKVLGTPTREEIYSMNPNYTEFKFPKITAHPWSKVFSKRMPPDAVDLVSCTTATWQMGNMKIVLLTVVTVGCVCLAVLDKRLEAHAPRCRRPGTLQMKNVLLTVTNVGSDMLGYSP